MSYKEKLNNLMETEVPVKKSTVDGLHRAEIEIDKKHFVGFEATEEDAVELAAKLAVFYIDPNNWVDDIVNF